MTATLLIAAALLTQSAAAAPESTGPAAPSEIAYDQIAEGQAGAAIARLRANADDPAALINLGAAFERKGMKRQALDCYRAAIVSETRYDLRLANGRWTDSRRAARLAAEALMKTGNFAMR